MIDDAWITRRSALRTGAAATGLVGLGTRVGTTQSDGSSADECYYQVEFVEGDPIETLGADEDAFYGRQNRLIQYVHATGDTVIERDTWLNSLDPEVRRCVTAEPISVDDGTVSVEFQVEEGCERTLSLTLYPLPGGEFSFESQQSLADAATGTFGPGTHELTVDRSSLGCPRPSGRYDQVAKLTDDDAARSDRFARSVAVSDAGDVAVVGAPEDDDAGRSAGAAYVFERTNGTWSQRTELTADDTAEGDVFGQSVGVSGSGDTAIVGASLDTRDDAGGAGAAYVFDRTDGTWSQRAKLVADDAIGGEQFGYSVAVSDAGDTAVVGAPYDEIERGRSGYVESGSAYVFGQTGGTWSQRAKLVSDSAVTGDEFGYSVAVSDAGDTVVVGAPWDDGAGSRAGAAYSFVRDDETWSQRAKLVADDAEGGDEFGYSVAVSGPGDTAVVGALTDDEAGRDSGAAYVFER